MNCNKKGNIGLAKVLLSFTEKGYQCFLPLSDTSLVDLIIANDYLETKLVQVKFLSLTKNGSIEIKTCSVVNGKKVYHDISKIDLYAVYCPETDSVYFISTKEIKKAKTFNIKVTTHGQNKQAKREAENYLSIEKAWNYGE